MPRHRSTALAAAALTAVLLVPALAGCRPVDASPGGQPVPVVAPATAGPPASPLPAPTAAVAPLPDRAGMAPESVTEALYAWFIAAVEASPGGAAPVYDGADLAASGYLAPALLERLRADRAAMAGGQGAADPLLCAQDLPYTVTANLEAAADGRASVRMASDLVGHAWGLTLELVDGAWRIAGIDCRPDEAAALPTPTPLVPLGGKPFPTGTGPTPEPSPNSAGQVVYVNAAYGFSLAYPTDWTHVEYANTPDQPPIGPEAVELQVLLMPQAWADALAARTGPPDPDAPVIAPFTVEVVRGDEAALRGVYPQPEQAAAIGLAGGPATREVEMLSDALYQVRYVLQHPADPELWLVLTDSITGFPDRAAGNEAALAAFAAILESLQLH